MWISYVAACFSLTGIWFNIKKNPICWFLFMGSDSLWFMYSVITGQWAITITHTVFMIVNFYGLYSWSKKRNSWKKPLEWEAFVLFRFSTTLENYSFCTWIFFIPFLQHFSTVFSILVMCSNSCSQFHFV